MTSYSYKGLTIEDWEKIEAFREQITHSFALGNHNKAFCQKKIKELRKFDICGKCQICGTVENPL